MVNTGRIHRIWTPNRLSNEKKYHVHLRQINQVDTHVQHTSAHIWNNNNKCSELTLAWFQIASHLPLSSVSPIGSILTSRACSHNIVEIKHYFTSIITINLAPPPPPPPSYNISNLLPAYLLLLYYFILLLVIFKQ